MLNNRDIASPVRDEMLVEKGRPMIYSPAITVIQRNADSAGLRNKCRIRLLMQ